MPRSRAYGACALASVVCGLASLAVPVRAQQLVLANLTYTATAKNTTNSGYRVPVPEGTPTNWKTPYDLTAGTAYARFEVLAKPSDEKTLYNVCFSLAADKLTCMPLSQPFTGKGVYNIISAVSAFWNYDQVDWTMGVRQVVLILKDGSGKLVQGDPKYFPITIKTTITFVPPGAHYMPPPSDEEDAGLPDGAARSDEPRDAGQRMAASLSAGSSPGMAGSGAIASALTQEDAGTLPPTPMYKVKDYLRSGGNCSAAGAAAQPAASGRWLLGLVGLLALGLRRRRAERR
jgi:MYXO-CTERM domain-containing protein